MVIPCTESTGIKIQNNIMINQTGNDLVQIIDEITALLNSKNYFYNSVSCKSFSILTNSLSVW